MNLSRFGATMAALAAIALVAGCGDDTMPGMSGHSTSTSTPAAHADHNQDDITFAQQMIVHHGQAVEMAKLVPDRSTNPEVLDLARRIQAAQDPEIQQMTQWLSAWGASPTSTSMPGMDHGSGAHPGMMSDEQMQQLQQATGTEFDRRWLEMMIAHHDGAIEMAETELSKGSNPDAKALAQQIIDTQQAEINEMRALLG